MAPRGVSLKWLTDDRVCKAWLYPNPKTPLHIFLRLGTGRMAHARRRSARDWFLQSSGKEACSKEPAARQPFQAAIFVSTRAQAFQGPAGCVLLLWWLWFSLARGHPETISTISGCNHTFSKEGWRAHFHVFFPGHSRSTLVFPWEFFISVEWVS